MFAIPGIVALLTFIYARPHEFVDAFRSLPLLYVFCGLAAFGVVIDLRLGLMRLRGSPALPWVLGFSTWCLLTAAVKAPASLPKGFLTIAILLLLYFVIAHGVQTFKGLATLTAVVVGCVMLVTFVGVHQGRAEMGCIAVDERFAGELVGGKPDGRSCVTRLDCIQDGREPGIDYRCERVGLLGTTSIGGGRVRYLGVLQDPNEMALAICIGLPFAFAFFERKKNLGRLSMLLLLFAGVAVATVFSQSRGGQLVFLTVCGGYFIKRFGWKGIAIGAVLALPMLMLGGRDGEEAESSSLERLECWYEGMSMWRASPILGVGFRQFTEHHYLTAHNSYVLALAELGTPGFFLWTMVLYSSAKIPASAMSRYSLAPGAEVARTWSMAMMTALAGLLVGVFFLSFCYHYVLWIYVGLAGALYGAIKAHDPTWEVKITLRDCLYVVGGNIAMIVILYVYTRIKAP